MMEMMIVVVIIGLLAALSLPKFGLATKKIKFDNIGRDILNTLRYAHSSAITLQQPYGVFFDNNHRRVVAFLDRVNVGSGLYEVGDSIVRSDTLDTPIGNFTTSFTDQTVIFEPDGRASQGGNVVAQSVDGASRSFSISLLASTGRAQLQYYH